MQHLKTVLTLARSAILPTVRTRRRAVYRKLIERYLHLLSRNIDYLGVGKRQGAVSRVGGSQQSLVISQQSTVNSQQSRTAQPELILLTVYQCFLDIQRQKSIQC